MRRRMTEPSTSTGQTNAGLIRRRMNGGDAMMKKAGRITQLREQTNAGTTKAMEVGTVTLEKMRRRMTEPNTSTGQTSAGMTKKKDGDAMMNKTRRIVPLRKQTNAGMTRRTRNASLQINGQIRLRMQKIVGKVKKKHLKPQPEATVNSEPLTSSNLQMHIWTYHIVTTGSMLVMPLLMILMLLSPKKAKEDSGTLNLLDYQLFRQSE
jgi:hypothetical protein